MKIFSMKSAIFKKFCKATFPPIFFFALAVPASASEAAAPALWETLCSRAAAEPLNFWAALIFLCAVIHSFSYRLFLRLAEKISPEREAASFNAEMAKRVFSLLGEVEVIFALWLIPLFAAICYFYGPAAVPAYLHELAYVNDKYAEAIFVFAIMCIASSRPIIFFASRLIGLLARSGKNTPCAWWCSVLCVGPLLGSFITEPAAISICATLLLEHTFSHSTSLKFKYATLGLLFVAVSVGGVLTPFAAPPIIMVAREWNWDSAYMISMFGWKSALAIALSVAVYAFCFRKEFSKMAMRENASRATGETAFPRWLVTAHIAFLAAAVALIHFPVPEIFLLLAFSAFVEITHRFQQKIHFRAPLLVAIFLASLVTHGSLQSWWIEPVLSRLSGYEAFAGSLVLSSFNDNAAITYLASLVPALSDSVKYFVASGAICAGGLTVIANAPNLVGLSFLKNEFPGGVSPLKLFAAAFFPTLLACTIFLTFP